MSTFIVILKKNTAGKESIAKQSMSDYLIRAFVSASVNGIRSQNLF